MNITWDAHLGTYIGAPEVVNGTAPQRYYMTDNLATQKWRLIGDSGTWYRWFLDNGNRTDSMVVGRTMRSYCSIACSTSDGEYSELTIGGNLSQANMVRTSRAMRIESSAGLTLGQVADGTATTAQRWSHKEQVAHAVALKQWQFVAVGDGSYRIQNLATGATLGVDSTHPAHRAWGVRPQATGLVTEGPAALGQQWWVIPTRSKDGVPDGHMRVVNRYTQTALSLGAHGADLTPVRSWTDRSGSTVGAGRTEAEQVLRVKAMGQAPDVVTQLTAGQMRSDKGQPVTSRMTATDSRGLPVHFTATGLPDGATLSPDGRITSAVTTVGVYQGGSSVRAR